MDEFTIQLVSNSSLGIFPTNTLSSFKTFLPEKINLEGDWYVGLLEITYPSQIKNFTDRVKIYEPNEDSLRGYTGRNIDIPAGLYLSEDHLLERIKDRAGFDLDWYVDSSNKMLKFTIPPGTGIEFSGMDAKAFLGLENNYIGDTNLDNPSTESIWVEAPYPVDVQSGKYTMFVYCDLIEYGVVGDVKAPILRGVPLISKIRNDIVQVSQINSYRYFDTPQYKNINRKSFQIILIELRSETGEPIPFFDVGRTVLTIHFKKVHSIN